MTRAPMLALLACAPALGRAELPSKQVLTLGVAKAVAEASEAEAQRRGSTVVAVVVDDGGHVLVLHRGAAAIEAAIKGTRTTRTNGEPEARATR